MNYREESLKKHAEWRGKIEITARVAVDTKDKLSVAYTPGVAEPCMAIHEDAAGGLLWRDQPGGHLRAALL